MASWLITTVDNLWSVSWSLLLLTLSLPVSTFHLQQCWRLISTSMSFVNRVSNVSSEDTTPMFVRWLSSGFKVCTGAVIHQHLPAANYRLLTFCETGEHIVKSDGSNPSLGFSIGVINTETNLISGLLVKTPNQTRWVGYFLSLIGNEADLLKLRSLFPNDSDVWLSLS